MTQIVPWVLLGWPLVTVALFARLPRRYAVVAAVVLGVLFLPEIHRFPQGPGVPEAISVPGFKLTKANSIAYALLIASLLFDGRLLLSLRPRWFDLPMIAWCVCPLLSSLSNNLGLYDGLSSVIDQTLTWGVPYLMGRLYCGDAAGLRAAAIGVVLGGLLYVPLCLCEARISPQLHLLLYGFHQHQFMQTIRQTGYRPMVFMTHGLEVGLWMTAATLLAFWLYRTGAVRRLPAGPYLPPAPTLGALLILLPTALLCRSIGALALGAAGFVVLMTSRWWKTRLLAAALLAAVPLYIGLRAASAWDGQDLVGWLATHVDAERSASLDFRLQNENKLLEIALERPMFGWGGWGRSLARNDEGKDIRVTDGMWIIALGWYGFAGLAAMCAAVLLPSARFIWHFRPSLWHEPANAAAAALTVLLALFMIDCLLNAMINPVFLLAAGGLSGLTCRGARESAAESAAETGEVVRGSGLPRPTVRAAPAELGAVLTGG